MKKKKTKLMGHLPKMPKCEIYLNVARLNDGNYELKIIDKNRLLKKTKFRKQ
ncbi:hypothetical protein [Costertonia aggregata]|uniref:Uncharacterized protein n=1 Tax=Costertonia aggregata TaxID=343403 RepID=A0A7H9ARX3_9FLAO|nr:hypothetical protein [Costertonia aggregata]QLG45935.1 hypothetical protein HYG79_11430 [Costertonia aggregata]